MTADEIAFPPLLPLEVQSNSDIWISSIMQAFFIFFEIFFSFNQWKQMREAENALVASWVKGDFNASVCGGIEKLRTEEEQKGGGGAGNPEKQ